MTIIKTIMGYHIPCCNCRTLSIVKELNSHLVVCPHCGATLDLSGKTVELQNKGGVYHERIQ